MSRWRPGLLTTLLLAACSGGTGGGGSGGCAGFCSDTPTALAVADVKNVIAQAVAEATARGAAATIAVVDRSGNPLGIFEMTGADTTLTTDGGRGVDGGLDGVTIIPSASGALSKAITAAYLSSEGNAFSTRTASQIIQLHFYPGEIGQPAGPLFGVQFSQLPCSDLSARLVPALRPSPGPHRSPLGLAGDPGGLPLYKDGVLVGGLGVMADGTYGVDRNIADRDQDLDELLALAGTAGFEAPGGRRADRIAVDGKPLRFSDARRSDLLADPANAPDFDTQVDGVLGARLELRGYTDTGDSSIVAGTAFGQAASGIRPATGALAALDAFVLVDSGDVERYPPVSGTLLSAAEVEQILASALGVANRARAQIRQPVGTPARVSVSIVDTTGAVLGLVRSRDAPMFGTDVALQKARTALLLSSANAASDFTGLGASYSNGENISIPDYVTALRNFLGLPMALADGAYAFTDRAAGNLSRPYFPDGVPGTPNGPLSKPIAQWSPFSTGLQLDLVHDAIVNHVKFVAGLNPDIAAGACTTPVRLRLANGIQIFPGSVPIYKGGTLAGAIGVSGDGVDQDDMIAFLGLHEASEILGTVGNAPRGIRADRLEPQGVRLRYIQCPVSPYVGRSAQNVCESR